MQHLSEKTPATAESQIRWADKRRRFWLLNVWLLTSSKSCLAKITKIGQCTS